MEIPTIVYVLYFILILLIVFLLGVSIHDRKAAKEREQELIAALLAKNLPEYAMASSELKSTIKDKIKLVKAENELAIGQEKIADEQGIPV